MDFIVIEGIDGSGKSTLIKELQKILLKDNSNYIFLKDPGDNNALLKDLRNMILEKNPNNYFNNLLFLASRSILIKNFIIPNLIKNKIVICDRFFISNIAYQGKVEQMGVKNIYKQNIELINSFGVIGKSMLNNLKIIYFDISAETAKSRNKNIDKFDKQSIEYFKEVKKGYFEALKFFDKDQVEYINAEKNFSEVLNDLTKVLYK